MLRIIALNEVNKPNKDEHSDELSLTQEAEETIAESEYMRAIRFKSQGKELYTLTLLNDLLKTKVLHEISVNNKNDKLWTIRYNCYKNIAVIYEEKKNYRMALENFILAVKLDDSDVFTMNRLGHLALSMNAFEIAEFAFEKCLRRNTNHWAAIDGILKLLCHKHNIFGIYGWATKSLSKDIKYKRALDVLNAIRNTFSDVLPFYKIMWNNNLPKHRFQKESIYILDNKKIAQKNYSPIPNQDNLYQLHEINWLSLGHYIVKLYTNLNGLQKNMLFILELSAIYKSANTHFLKSVGLESKEPCKSIDSSSSKAQKCISVNSIETSESNLAANDSNIVCNPTIKETNSNNSVQKSENDTISAEIDSILKSDSNENTKSKPRRRCSDLHFLEQWGWHKNRRYSSRKKNHDRAEIDASLKGFLHRIFFQYLKPFDTTWPFKTEIESNDKNLNAPYENNEADICTNEFQIQTQSYFDHLLVDLKSSPFDLLSLMNIWLKYVSAFWKDSIPAKLKEMYISVYTLYMNHIDFLTCNQFILKDINEWYEISTYFLELEYASVASKNCDITDSWKSVLKHLCYYAGNYLHTEGHKDIVIRLIYMEYCFAMHKNDILKSINYLKQLELLLENQENNFTLLLPHLKTCISKEYLFIIRTGLERKLALARVPKLVEEKKWSELVAIISVSLLHSNPINGCEQWDRNLQTQFEVLLLSLWNMCDLEKCLTWSEMCLHYAVVKYLSDINNSKQQSSWSETINYIFIYIESVILREGFIILNCLGENLSRLVQNTISILCLQLDAPFDKHNNPTHEIDFKQPFVVLYQVILRDEDRSPFILKNKTADFTGETEEYEDLIPHSFLVLFTAHEFLGKRFWCTRDNGALLLYILDVITPNLRAPIFDSFRDIVYEHLEQVTYCLYGFPPKKARSRHIEDHESNVIEITWRKAIQLIDLYRPECLPEFNSYKFESVSADMEQLLVKTVLLANKEVDTTSGVSKIKQFINGERESLPDEVECIQLPYKISCIYYLLADYYFKNRDFSKTIKYYILDLACNPTRFDSWAGIALSKASKIETKLNDFQEIELSRLLTECDETIRCFEQCIKLHHSQTLLWIEYGSFTYTVHSFCSRHLKQLSHKLSLEQFTFVEERKEKMLNISYNCFSLAASLQNSCLEYNRDLEESNEETWLCQYMLGKISEKRKENPKVCINHYLKAANYLYESNATYPIKINHSNPTPLSVEALEIFYRINAVIIKFLEHESEINRETRNIFKSVLKNLSKSPFAFNKAKIDGNSLNVLKRNINNTQIENQIIKKMKFDLTQKTDTSESTSTILVDDQQKTQPSTVQNNEMLRRKSNESILTTESSESESGSNSSSTNSSESTSSDSETDLDSEKNSRTHEDITCIYNNVVRNLEECVTRFPEHYKSSYRLVYHYMNGPEDLRNFDYCEQLLLSQYTTSLGNQINGIFFDRKGNNIFNGIWRLPSSEIDRPGSFSNHLVKCVTILIQLLMKKNNYKLLIDVGLQLYKTPDNDKRYIKDVERMELYHQSINFCVQVMRDIFKKITCTPDDNETLTLLIDIYKSHKKCLKYLNQKEPLFTQLLIDVYKYFIQNKVEKIPEQINLFDLAIKLCLQEISARKCKEKSNDFNSRHLWDNLQGTTLNTKIQIPGLQIKNRMQVGRSGFTSDTISEPLSYGASTTTMNYQNILPTYASIPNPFKSISITDTIGLNNLLGEYYNMFQTGSTNDLQLLYNKTKSELPVSYLNPSSLSTSSASKTNYSQLGTSNTTIGITNSTSSMGELNSFNKHNLSLTESKARDCNDGQQVVPELCKMNTTNVQSINTFTKREITCNQVSLVSEKSEELANNMMDASCDNKNILTQKAHTNHTTSSTNFLLDKSKETIGPFSNHDQKSSLLATYSNLITNSNLMSQQIDMRQIPILTQNMNNNLGNPLSLNSDTHLLSYAADLKNACTSAYGFLSHANIDLPLSHNNDYLQKDRASSTNKKLISSQKNTYQVDLSKQFPNKTLQQKLAERQRANQQKDSDGPTCSKYKSNSDVIILD